MSAKALLGGTVAALAITAQAQQCHNYVLISTRGTFEKQGPSIGFTGMINTTLSTLPNGIEYDTLYPASTNFTSSVTTGVSTLQDYITSGLASCPQQKYVLLGYSQGASVTDLALTNFTSLSSPAYNAIKAGLVIGNPGHVPNSPSNVDQFGGNSTRNLTSASNLAGGAAIPDVYYANGKVLDICYQGDPVCGVAPNGTFNVEYAHVKYGSTPSVQELGAEFLVSKLNGTAQAGNASTTSSGPAVYTGAAGLSFSSSGSGLVFAAFLSVALAVL